MYEVTRNILIKSQSNVISFKMIPARYLVQPPWYLHLNSSPTLFLALLSQDHKI